MGWYCPNLKKRKTQIDKANELGLDQGIARAVMLLREGGIETFESCQGGAGHSYPEPTIRFHGEYPEGFKAYSIVLSHGLPVYSLRRIYQHQNGELKGPWWEMTFAISPRLGYSDFSE